MNPRRWLLPGVLLALFTAAVILPATDPGREWLLERAIGFADELGYRITYTSSSGNPWFGIELDDVTVRGPGVDISSDSLSVGYFLPSLLTGDLPLSVGLTGVRGDVDPAGFAAIGGAGGDALVTPRLRDLSIRDVAIEVDGSPWTLPALDVEEVQVEQTPEGLRFAATIRSVEGSASFQGSVAMTPWRLEVQILEADATLARHWWDGVLSGKLQGRLIADAEGVAATGHLRGGSIAYLGARVESISGPVSYEGGLVEANLAGTALGGPVTASVDVNVPASHWEGSLQGTPELAPLAAWLSKGDFSTDALDVTGTARVQLEAEGWSEVTLSGRGSGDGTILGFPLDDLSANFAYTSSRGADVEASATLAGGPLVMTLRPERERSRLRLAARDVAVSDDLDAEWDASVSFSPSGTSGNLEAALEGRLAGRELSLEADGVLDEDGVQLFARGRDELGAAIEGAAVIANGAVEGQLKVDSLALPALGAPVDLTLSGKGPIAELPLELRLAGEGSSALAAYGISVEEELSGSARGTLAGGRIRNLQGQFGPLGIEGQLSLSPFGFEGAYSLSSVRATGLVEATLESSGSLEFSDDSIQGSGEVNLERLASSGAGLSELVLDYEAVWGEAEKLVTLESQESTDDDQPLLQARVTGESAEVEVNTLPATLAERPVSLDGSFSLPYGGEPSADLALRSGELLLTLRPAPDGHQVQIDAQPGLELGSLTLRRPLEASGQIDGELEQGSLQGTVADTPFTASFERVGSDFLIELTLGANEETFAVSFDGSTGTWAYAGALDVGSLAEAFGLPVKGRVTGDLRHEPGAAGAYSGELKIDGSLSGIPLDLTVSGENDRLVLAGVAETAGVGWQISGTTGTQARSLVPTLGALDITATSPYGRLRLEGTNLSGTGTLPRELGALTTSGGAWSLTGDLAEARVSLSTDSSEAVVDWSAGAELEADLEEPFELAGVPAKVSAHVSWSAGGSGSVEGTLGLGGQQLALAGDLEEIRLDGNLDAASLSEEIIGTSVLAGTFEVTATLPTSQPTAATANVELVADGATLTAQIKSTPEGLEATLNGPGLEGVYSGGVFRVAAQEAPLGTFLAPTQGPVVANGTLARTEDAGWEGALALRGEIPLPGAPSANVELTGAGPTLRAEGLVDAEQYRLEAEGTLFPALDLALSASALDDNLSFNGSASGSPGAPVLEGTVSSDGREVGPLTLPVLTLSVRRSPDGVLTVAGEGVNVSLGGEEGLTGRLDLGLGYAGQEHRLQGEVAGSPALPQVDLRLVGPLASGTAEWQEGSGNASLEVDPAPVLPSSISARGPAGVQLSFDRSLEWQATVSAPIAAVGERLLVEAELSGSGFDYGGGLTVEHVDGPAGESTLLQANLEGDGSGWRLSADLAEIDAPALAELLPVESRLEAVGAIELSSDRVGTIDGAVTGELAGRPIELNLSGDSASALTATGNYFGASFEAEVDGDGVNLELSGPDDVDLSGTLTWGEALELTLAGEVTGSPFEANALYDSSARAGSLAASLAGARLEAKAQPAGGESVRVDASLTGPDGEAGAPAYTARTTLVAGGDSVLVESFSAGQATSSREWGVDLSGPLWPIPTLTGSLAADLDPLEGSLEAALELTGPSLSQPQLVIAANGLELKLGRFEERWAASLSGDGTVADAQLQGDLYWSPSSGFDGNATVALATAAVLDSFPPSRLAANLTGTGNLDIEATLLLLPLGGTAGSESAGSESAESESAESESPGSESPGSKGTGSESGEYLAAADIALSARPWQDSSLSGEVRFGSEVDRFWPAYPGEPLAVSGQLSLGGTILDPTASGPVALAGALEGSGTAAWEDGQGTLELSGEALSLTGSFEAGGAATATVNATELQLGALWPAATGATANLSANLTRSPGGELSGELVSFEATRGSSSIDASALLADSLEAHLNLDLDLADIPLAQPSLVGTLVGTVDLEALSLDSIEETNLRGDLELAGAGVEGNTTRLSGEVRIAGEADDPVFDLGLEASVGAQGELLVSARPSVGRLQLSSDIRWGDVVSRVQIDSGATSLSASGSIELPGGYFDVSAPTGTELILLQGAGSYEGWQAQLDTGDFSVALAADLSTLDTSLRGTISAMAGGDSGDGSWLEGEAADLGWNGITLGDLDFSSGAAGAPIHIDGERIEASLDPLAGPDWRVERLNLDLPNGLLLTGSGAGDDNQLSGELVVSGEVAGSPATLPLHLERTTETPLSVSGSGTLLDGAIAVDVALDETWNGTITGTAIEAAGLSVDLVGRLSGGASAPSLDLEASAEAGYASVALTALLSLEAQRLDAQIVSPYLDETLTIEASSEEGGRAVLGSGTSRIEVNFSGEEVVVSGGLVLPAGPARLALNGVDEGLNLLLSVPALPGLALATTVDDALLTNPGSLLETPLTFDGRQATTGVVELSLTPVGAKISDLHYDGEALGFEMGGTAAPGQARLAGVLNLDGTTASTLFPTLPAAASLPFEVILSERTVEVSSDSEFGKLDLGFDLDERSGTLATDLQLAGGSLSGRVEFIPGEGPRGSLSATDLPLLLLADQDPLRVTGEFGVTPQALDVTAQLEAANGSLQASGSIGLARLLPAELAPEGGTGRRLELQLGTFDLSGLPWVARRLPHLSAPLSGFLQIQGSRVVGRFVSPDMTVAGDPLPLTIDVSGSDEAVTVSGLLAGSPIQVEVDSERLSALVHLERFPLHLLAQAATGPLDVSAEVTGVARFELPLTGSEGPVVEIATELVRLERAGVVTTGNISLTFVDGALTVNEAHFSGAGTWQAQGAIRRDLLDLSLTATDADFGPLLGLVPLFARYEVGASGSLELNTSGTLADPVITLTTPALEFEVAGSSYRLTEGQASLEDERLEVDAVVEGIEPFTGKLEVTGAGRVDLLPLSLGDARFEAVGDANVPGLGAIQEFEAVLTSEPNEPLRIEGGGRLGEPFTLEGTLLPLDLTLTGDDLSIRLPYLLLASAQVDTQLRMQWLEALRFSGRIGVDQALFELGIRPPSDGGSDEPNPVAQQVVFDGVTIEAPGRVRFMENFGSAETALSLTLGGTAAQPTLGGTAQVLRGTIRFSGRDFEIVSAQARFDPTRGVLPIVDVTAVTTFDVDQVLPSDGSVRFVEPDEGSRFEVALSFTGELESTPGTNPPFRLDLTPALTSEAVIQEENADGTTGSPRPLTEPELLSLITLGRLDLEAPLASEAGLAGAVAEGAIDTAVDLLLVSELQDALADALGVDVVEINTTAISSIFGRSQTEPFSVSLRLGGYLSDEVFASYRIGTFDDVEGLYALTNEVNLIYELGPVEIDLAGRVNFEDTDVPTPDAEVSATVRYDFSPLTAIEGGIDLSDERQQVRFGVTLRW